MSKISDENSAKASPAQYWRLFVVLATAWWRKYGDDPFFRTEIHAIALQIAFAALILVIVGISYNLINQDVSTAILSGIRANIATSSASSSAATIVQEIQTIRYQSQAIVVLLIIVATIISAYVIARLTLAPARNALAAQKQFIGNIAHELRTPLAIIKTNTEVALLETGIAADMRQTLVSNIEELDRISEIINNLLSLSALIKPEQMVFAPVDLSEVASGVAEKYARLAAANSLSLTVKKTPRSMVYGNATALNQIVGNLLKNAITYTPRLGTIVVTVAPTRIGEVELMIQDTGVGIARKDLFRIFEPFYQTDQSRTRSKGGSGLGLAIVSELVKLHHGRISVRSAVGRGTTVSVQFPVAKKTAKVGTSENKEGPSEIAVDFTHSETHEA